MRTARNKERRNAARALFLQDDRGLGDAAEAADPSADQNAGFDLLFIGGRLPARIGKRLRRRRHRVKNEIVDFALLFRLHPMIGVEARVITAAASRNRHGNLAGKSLKHRTLQSDGRRFGPRANGSSSARPR